MWIVIPELKNSIDATLDKVEEKCADLVLGTLDAITLADVKPLALEKKTRAEFEKQLRGA